MKVIVHRKAGKVMKRFPKYVQDDITEICVMLESWPAVVADIKKMGTGIYRIRKGGYRLMFQVVEESDLIVVFEIESRGKMSYAKG